MLFVADGFPEELVRVIEFLNEQMSPAGVVLGIEVRQYTDPDRIQQVLVPRVVGATSVAERTKATSGATKWTRATLVDEATVAATPEVIAQLDRSLDAAEASGVNLSWGSGQTPRVSVWRLIAGEPRPTLVRARPAVRRTDCRHLARRPDRQARPCGRPATFDQLAQLPGFGVPFRSDTKFPEATIADLGPEGVERLLAIIDEFAC